DLIAAERLRREDAFVARFFHELAQTRALRVIDVRVQIVDREHLAREGRRLGRKRLRRPRLFTRHVALRHRPLFDRPERLARHALEYIKEAELRGQRDDVDHLALMLDSEKLGRGGRVVIPEIVGYDLKMPEALACACVQRENAISEQSHSLSIAAVAIVRGRAEREIRDAALFVNRDFAPRVDASDVRPRVPGPSVVAELAGVRDRVEAPHELAGDHIVRAYIARRGAVHLAGLRPDDDEILEHAPWRRTRTAERTRLADAHVHAPIVAEGVDRDAGARVELGERIAGGGNEAAIATIFALPVIDAALHHRAFEWV